MHQQTFAEATFERYRKPPRREQFLDEMDQVSFCFGTLLKLLALRTSVEVKEF